MTIHPWNLGLGESFSSFSWFVCTEQGTFFLHVHCPLGLLCLMHTDNLLYVFIWSLCSGHQSSLQGRKKTLHLHIPAESQIFFFLLVLIDFPLPHTDLMFGLLSSNLLPFISYQNISRYVLARWNRGFLGTHCPLLFLGTQYK